MICQQITVNRTQDGKAVSRPLLVAYDRRTDQLAIYQHYRPTKGTWADRATYLLERLDVSTGQAFYLHRAPHDVAEDPQTADRYAVYLGDQWDECDCRGKYASERRGQPCKHVDCLRWLLANRHIREPEYGGVGA